MGKTRIMEPGLEAYDPAPLPVGFLFPVLPRSEV